LAFDASPTLVVERLIPGRKRVFPANVRYGDIVRGLPLDAESCDAVYCSHVLEHLALEDFRAALRNAYRTLRPGGTFRIVVPDLAHDAREYLASESPQAAHAFMSNTHLAYKTRERRMKALLVAWLGNTRHLWMWYYKSLNAELEATGFADIRRARRCDNPDPLFARVEDERQWGVNLGVECRRPTGADAPR